MLLQVIVSTLLLPTSYAKASNRPPYPDGLPSTNAATCIRENGHIGDRITQQACNAFGSGAYKTGTDSSSGFSWKACISDDFGPADLQAWHQTCQKFSGHGRICYYQDEKTKSADSLTCVNADCVAEQTCVKGGGNVGGG